MSDDVRWCTCGHTEADHDDDKEAEQKGEDHDDRERREDAVAD